MEIISTITRWGILHDGATPREGTPPAESPKGGEPPEHTVTPLLDGAGQPTETQSAEFLLLNRPGHSRHHVTPAMTCAGIAARSVRGRNANNHNANTDSNDNPIPVHLAAIATDSTLSKVR